MSRVTPLVAALALVGCGEVPFDFGVPGEDADASACPEEAAEPAGCEGDAAPCAGFAAVALSPVGRTAGCTPAGLPVGVVRLDLPGPEGVDLLAWAEPPAGSDDPFLPGAALALFGDECGDEPLGGGLDCAYEPWLMVEGLHAGVPVFLHVQAGEAGAARVGYELRPAGTWSPALPSAGEPLACDGDLEDLLVSLNPWPAPVDLDLSRNAPASGRDPWFCGTGAAGWRQAGFALHNPYDAAIVLRGVRLVRQGSSGGPPLYHFALVTCSAGGPSPIAASSCVDPGDDPSKSLSFELAPWVPGDLATEYALVLQVPPSEGTAFSLTLEADLGP